MFLKWAWREIRYNRGFSLFFTLNLLMGLAGFLCLNGLKSSLNESLLANSRNLLGGDVAVSVRRLFSDQELETIRGALPAQSQSSRMWEFFSMVSSPTGSRLVDIKAVDASYPLYGALQLQGGEAASGKDLQSAPRAWIESSLLTQLGVKVGDRLQLGNQSFEVAAVIDDDPTQSFRLASLAPRIYVGMDVMRTNELISFGTTLSDVILTQLPESMTEAEVKNSLEPVFLDPAVRVRTAQESALDTIRVFNYLSDYLGLVSLVALFLACIGSSYLFHAFLQSKVKEMAILNALGVRKSRAALIYLLQTATLSLFASALALALSFLIGPLLASMIQPFAPVPVSFHLSADVFALGAVLALVSGSLVSLPLLISLGRVQTRNLLQEESSPELQMRGRDWAWYLPALVVFYFLSVWQAHSWKVGSIFFLALVGALAFLYLFSSLAFVLMKRWPARAPSLRLSLWQVLRKPGSALTFIVALSLAIVMIDFIPQIQSSLEQQMESPSPEKVPSLFLFDIQDEQKAPFEALIKEKGFTLQQISPMIRSRLLKVNGTDFERVTENGQFATREEETEARFRNRGVNLSFRDQLSNSEELIAGRDFSGRYDPASEKPVEISMEERYATRMGVSMGDRLLFDVQGVEIEGQVISLRKVKWTTFQPNFFVLVQPGSLEEAPKTWIASISRVPDESLTQLQADLVKSFPNVSLVDVKRTVNKILEITSQMSAALLVMAALTFGAGLLVLGSISRHQARKRRWDLNLMKILGAPAGFLRDTSLLESLILGTIAVVQGFGISYLLSQATLWFIFEEPFVWNPLWTFGSMGLGLLLVLVIGWLSSRSVILESPRAYLNRYR